MRQWILTALLCLCVLSVYADDFPVNTFYHVCFTPQEHCTRYIVDAIDRAKHTIHVQAYSFTSWRITRALVAAAKRSVQVQIIMDQTQFHCPNYSHVRQLLHAGIAIRKDKLVARHRSKKIIGIAHNKVMIIDDRVVITGSFNFTYSAQHYNAENSLIIQSKQLAHQYLNNWSRRAVHANKITSFACYRH